MLSLIRRQSFSLTRSEIWVNITCNYYLLLLCYFSAKMTPLNCLGKMSPYWCGAIVFHPCAQNSLLICAALIHLHDGGMAIKIHSKYGKLFSRALIVYP
jgi:hypothetical protein